ncbi:hypothetical protein [Nocardia bovistercoris]|uniref:Uncharacterized protein n=1 Tax=Nocardia bovistercoris TaxID=2785916 RepID=A0A931N5E4_9NOCA|nr:hypothetical protein [Nocardia bovistercoris]MBH0779316.1 hypothetical protein [Nocardia bovistercoris]
MTSREVDNEEKITDLLSRAAVDELRVIASVGGSAEFELIEDLDQLKELYPDATEMIQFDGALPEPAADVPAVIGPFHTGNITFNNGVPVNGFASLTLHRDGKCVFTGHFHDSGFPSYDLVFVWVITDSAGTAYTFTAKGRMHGTSEPGSRNVDWNRTVVSPQVAANWPKLVRGWRWHWKARVNFNPVALLNSVLDALKVAGAVIGAVIAVI